MLQDAGLIPVDVGMPQRAGRPRGISDNIPQSAIDEMIAADGSASAQREETQVIDT